MITLTATTTTGESSSLSMSQANNAFVTVEFTPQDADSADLDTLVAHGPYGGETFTVEFVDSCIPARPFYIRYIRRQGGYAYYMFTRRKQFTEDTRNSTTFNPYINDTENGVWSRAIVNKEATESVTAGDQQLSFWLWRELMWISNSPKIEWFCEAIQKWLVITIESASNSFDSESAFGSIEYNFILPRVVLQF